MVACSKSLFKLLSVASLAATLHIASDARAHFTTVINVPPNAAPTSIGSHTQLNLHSGGTLPSNVLVPFHVGDSGGSSTHVELNVVGGFVDSASANAGSTVNVSAGMVGIGFAAKSGSQVHIRGGAVNREFESLPGSTVTIAGSEFHLNGTPVAGLSVPGSEVQLDLPTEFVLNGTLADGKPFVFGSQASDFFAPGTLRLRAEAVPPASPAVFHVPAQPAPPGLRQGQTMNLNVGGTIPDMFHAGPGSQLNIAGGGTGRFLKTVESTVNVSSGTILDNYDAFGGEVNITGGLIDRRFSAKRGAVVNLTAGAIGQLFTALPGSTVNISGGSVELGFHARGSVVNISGGTILSSMSAFENSVVNMTGGVMGPDFHVSGTANISGGLIHSSMLVGAGGKVNVSGGAGFDAFKTREGSHVNLIGRDFKIDGVPIAGLASGVATTINDRRVTLSGVFADGSPFDFQLNVTDFLLQDYFRRDALLSVTLVPEPTSLATLAIPVGVGVALRRRRP